MTIDPQEIERLWSLQRAAAAAAAAALQALADHMANLPTSGVIVSQERWDQLFGSWNCANERMQDIGRALMAAHGLQD
ncbi:exported hypothetical protein [Cupriavidus taiwanensis]|uniref:Uncharacterized protein n=1 Tax=Cupriavidus taiwanensis TaxID=164546 RepID=A0A375HDT9_9BURK|nr:hypothetical protein [Cupriavidus taiwanensis]SOZ73348.1 exported hypothetical protein [Cupriavidus taiwanensis]SPA03873.1 exported hypothetical protein [Cupriavidus taiwanensis]SPA12943.1 exported hypothetical protein [Cupriavidus taiwanensis]SPD49076.1 protein of unknown function [Cupriavidus taiwanensis]